MQTRPKIAPPAPAVQPVPSSAHVAHAHPLAVLPVVRVSRAVTCLPASARFSAGPRFTRPRVTEGRASLTFTSVVFFKTKMQRLST